MARRKRFAPKYARDTRWDEPDAAPVRVWEVPHRQFDEMYATRHVAGVLFVATRVLESLDTALDGHTLTESDVVAQVRARVEAMHPRTQWVRELDVEHVIDVVQVFVLDALERRGSYYPEAGLYVVGNI